MNDSYPMQHQLNSKKRRRLNSEETKILQAVFERNPKPDAMLRAALADRLGMTARNIQIWFQNKRAKTKKTKRDGSDDESCSPTTATEFNSVSMQEVSPTEDSTVKSKAILPKVYYPPSDVQQMMFSHRNSIDMSASTASLNSMVQQVPISSQVEAIEPVLQKSASFEQSLDMFNEVTCNDFDFLNFLEDC